MRIQRCVLVLACLLLLGWLDKSVQAQQVTLQEVPTYYWYHGCSPTAGMMALGYWDAYGYSNLIPGSNNWITNQAAIQDAIASPGHIADYALYGLPGDKIISTTPGSAGIAYNSDWTLARPWEDTGLLSPYSDLSTVSPSTAHSSNSLADFMGTSRSSLGLTHGGSWTYDLLRPVTWTYNISAGIGNYASYRGYSFDVPHTSGPSWNSFTTELLFGRPVVLNVTLVDSDGNPGAHSVTAVGYRTVAGQNQYGFRDTWDGDIQWLPFDGSSSFHGFTTWQIDSMEAIRPAGSWDAKWNTSVGYWSDAGKWDKNPLDIGHYLSAPNSSAFAAIPEGGTAIVDTTGSAAFVHNLGTLQLDGGTLTATQFRNPGTIIGHGEIVGSVHNFGQITACYGSITLTGNGDSTGGTFTPLQGNRIRIQATTGSFDLYGTNTITGSGALELVQGDMRAPASTTAELGSSDPDITFLLSGGRVLADAGGTLRLNFTNGASISLAGGTIGGGAGQVVNVGSFNLTTGAVVQGGFSNSSPEMSISGNIRVPRDGSLTNTGIVRHVGGTVFFGNDPWYGGATGCLNNLAGATYDLQCDGVLFDGQPYFFEIYHDVGIINNAGLFRKSAGTGTSTVSGLVAFNNTGTVEVDCGTLVIGGYYGYLGSSRDGHYKFVNGTRLQASMQWAGQNTADGDGVLDIGGGVAVGTTATFNSSQLTNGARLELGQGATGRLNVEAGAMLSLNMTGSQQATVANGYLGGGGTTVNVGNLVLSGGAVGGDDPGVVINRGNFVWTGGEVRGSGSNGGLRNESGQFVISGNGSQTIGDTYYGGGMLSNVGTITQAVGGTLQLLRYSTLSNLAGGVYDLQGDGQITTYHTFWNDYAGGTINNAGLFRKSSGTGTSAIDPSIAFNNTGTVEVDSGTLSIGSGSSTGAHYEFTNGGQLNASVNWAGENTANGVGVLAVGGNVSPGTSSTFSSSGFTNGARLELGQGATGRLSVDTGATLTVNMTGSQQATVANGYLCGGGTTVNLGNLVLSGGTIGGDDPGVVINRGNLVWTGGEVRGYGSNGGLRNESSHFTISGNGGQTIGDTYYGGGMLSNVGTITQAVGGTLQLLRYSTLNNLAGGVYDLQGDGQITTYHTFWNDYAGGTINNAGLFRKSSGTGASAIDPSIAFNNTGTVEVDSGSLSFGNFTQSAGLTYLKGGSLAFQTPALVQGGKLICSGSISGSIVNSGGTLTGEGSVGALTVNMGGVLAPGNPTTGTGILTAGNLTLQNNVTLSLAITKDASGTAGVNYAQLSVQVLDISTLPSISVSLQNVSGDGSIFDASSNHLWQNVITTTGITGFNSSLFTINSSNFFGGDLQGGFFSIIPDQTNLNALELQYIAVPEPQTWALLAGAVGLFSLRRRSRIPASGIPDSVHRTQ